MVRTNLFRTALSLMLGFVLMLTMVFSAPFAFAETSVTGIIITESDPLNVRSEPSAGARLVGTVPKGASVKVLDKTNASWYLIEYESIKGYASSKYIQLITVTPDQDFDAYLTQQGFPESYKPYLRTLHSLHPNWIFIPNKTGLDWNSAVKAECAQGMSLTAKNYSIGSELSYEKGAYNFETSQHIVYDSGGWVMASQALVEYSLDPRNYLSTSYIFAFKTMSYSAMETYDGVTSIVKSSFLNAPYPDSLEDSAQFATYSDAIMAAAKEAGISAYHLASYIVQEQGNSGTELSFGTYPGIEGYYNLLNINAYSSGGKPARQMGAEYAKSVGWNTPYKAMLGGAKKIVSGYINVGQDNIYLKKFDLASSGGYYNHQYMTNIKGAFAEASKLASAYEAFEDTNYTFNIPIFNNMPESACPKPTSTGSNNNVLKSISIEGQTLTPSFDKYTYSYDLIVEANVESVNIAATPYDSTAKISGAGNVKLNQGNNSIKVVSTAASGSVRTYTFNIFRQEGGAEQPVTPPPPSIAGSYSVGEYITGVGIGTDVNSFITKLGVSNGTAKVYTSAGAEKTGAIATGDVVKILQNNEVKLTYTVVIFGDTNGDSKVTTLDLLVGQRHILGVATLSGAKLKACDINRDGRISTVDLLSGQRHILNITPIKQ